MKSESGREHQLELSPKQQAEVKELTGKDVETITLTIEELEERIAPGIRLRN
jgi:hypothetical protein